MTVDWLMVILGSIALAAIVMVVVIEVVRRREKRKFDKPPPRSRVDERKFDRTYRPERSWSYERSEFFVPASTEPPPRKTIIEPQPEMKTRTYAEPDPDPIPGFVLSDSDIVADVSPPDFGSSFDSDPSVDSGSSFDSGSSSDGGFSGGGGGESGGGGASGDV